MASEQQPSRAYTDDELRYMQEAGRSDLLRTLTPDERARLEQLTREPGWGETIMSGVRGAGRLAAAHPAETGALAAGLLAAPFTGGMSLPAAMTASGAAGAIGAGTGIQLNRLRQAASGEVPDPLRDTPRQMAEQGASMAVGEGMGRGVVSLARGSSKWLMNRAMNNMAQRLSNEFPTLTQDMIDNAISVSKGGYEKAKRLLRQWKAVATDAVQKADASGARIPMTTATDAVGPGSEIVDRILHSGAPKRNQKRLEQLIDDFAAGRGVDLRPVEADKIKRELQREAEALYTRRARGLGTPGTKVREEAKAAMAAALNTAIDDVAKQAGATGEAGYKYANKQTQSMIGVTRGLRTARRPSGNLYQALVRPGIGMIAGGTAGYQADGAPLALTGAVLGGALGSPAGLSRAALLLGNPAVQAFIGQLPKPLAQAVMASQAQTPIEEP